MRINLNLGMHQSALERYALYWATPVALASLVALAYLATAALRNFRLYQQVSRSVADCQGQQNLLSARQTAAIRRLQQPQFQGVLREAGYINSLIDQRRLSLTGLTAKIDRLLPPDVRLISLALSSTTEGPLVRMTIEGPGQQEVIGFVEKIEESPDFADPVISSEDPGEAGGPAPSPGAARLVCTALYAGWQSPESAVERKERSGTLESGGPKSEIRKRKSEVAESEARRQKQEVGTKR